MKNKNNDDFDSDDVGDEDDYGNDGDGDDDGDTWAGIMEGKGGCG